LRNGDALPVRPEAAMEALSHFTGAVFGNPAKAQDLVIWQAVTRALLVYVVLLVAVRVGKKRFLGEATAFDAILVIIIGSTASRGILGNAPLGNALIAVIVLVAFHWLISLISRDWPFFSRLIKGSATPIIKDGVVLHASMSDAHMSPDDLDEDLRAKGVVDPAAVAEARLERDGKLSVVKK
jgi:uncharacterized membrane protein YcaP (DUF421 family)